MSLLYITIIARKCIIWHLIYLPYVKWYKVCKWDDGFCSVPFTPIKRKLNEICIYLSVNYSKKELMSFPLGIFPNDVPITSIAWIRNIWKLKQRSWLLLTKDNTKRNLKMTLRGWWTTLTMCVPFVYLNGIYYLYCFIRYSQLREAAIMLKNVEPELIKCEGYKRNLAAEQVNS